MSSITLTHKQKNKHLNLEHYSFIVDQVINLLSSTKEENHQSLFRFADICQ